ncbi:MAG: glycine cleavage system protein T, partial [Alphaproteobacteria bacterium]|nr:glycine cleavage system protein T [Alphaproteobacteria bacterium]
ERDQGPKRRLVTLTVDAKDADVIGDEPVWHDGKVVGWITSGGYAHHVGKSVALGYIPAELAKSGGGFEVEIIGERRKATLAPRPLYDPDGLQMRG